MLNAQHPVGPRQPAAAPPAGATYAVLALDRQHRGGRAAPPFGSLTRFSSLTSRSATTSMEFGNLVLWDGTYDGLSGSASFGFVLTAAEPGTGAMTSPDIVISGMAAAQDASSPETTASSNNSGTLSATAYVGRCRTSSTYGQRTPTTAPSGPESTSTGAARRRPRSVP